MTKKKSNFRDKVTSDSKRQKSAASSYGYLKIPKGVSVFSPDPGGRAKLDFLPYEVTDPKHPDKNVDLGIAMVGDLWYKRPFQTHRNIGAGNDVVVCLTSVGKKCPICEYRAKKIKGGADKEDTDLLRPSKRNLYVVIPKGVKGKEEVPHIFDISQFLFQNLLNDELEEDDENGIFPDLAEGKTLKIRFASRTIGKGQPFAEADRIDFLERDEIYDDAILEDVPNLDEMLTILTYNELWAKFSETEDEEDGGDLDEDDDDDANNEKHSNVKKKTLSHKKVEDDDEEDDNEEDEEDEKPKRKTSTKAPAKKAKVDENDEDEDDEGEDEDDDDEKPIRKSSTSLKKKKLVEKDNEDEDEDEDEEEKPKTSRTIKKQSSSKGKPRCPNGHIFGKDFDTFDDCADCPLFDACGEENDK